MQHSKPAGPGEGTLYGSKITGGGSGGTVCIVGRNCLRSNDQILQVASIFSYMDRHNARFYSLILQIYSYFGFRLQIQKRYEGATGYLPIVFEGSSPGAGRFGHLRIRRRLQSKQN